MDQNTENRLKPYFTPLGAWAFSIGTAIGWGSFMVTCSSYLQSAGAAGTIFGILAGMLVILVITRNLHYIILNNQDAGGIYSYTQKSCSHDLGFLAAWFLLLAYLSVLWANITSVPLFARYFLGDIFRFGFHYRIFGYEVYFGEALLSVVIIVLTGLLCAKSRKLPHDLNIIFVFAFAVILTLCSVFTLFRHSTSSFTFEPAFLPDSSIFRQIVHIAVITPWAFIGFENICHFSEEFSFPVKKVKKILLSSVIITTALYILVSLLSISAYPPEYDSWLAYVRDMGNLEGIKGVPAFYAVWHYWGNGGVAVLLAALLCVILSSLIGNVTALSRLLYAAGRDGEAPEVLGRLNKKHIPSAAVTFVTVISLLIPFLGRTAIGWIVDVTTLGSSILYAIASYAVFTAAKRASDRKETVSGLLGLILMGIYIIILLIPNLVSKDAMESESYIFFAFWAIAGLIYFRHLIAKDRHNRYAGSIIVWGSMLLMVLLASMMWVSKATRETTTLTMEQIHQYYQDNIEAGAIPENDMEFLNRQAEHIDNLNALYTVASFTIFIVSITIILMNYSIMIKREKEHQEKLHEAESKAATDPLTGIKNRLAYEHYESLLNEQIRNNQDTHFAIVIADINDLKYINDTFGHNAGDDCIRNACKRICHTYKHSPVFRIGGDEFAIILQGADYEDRNELMSQIMEVPENAIQGSTLAVGMSEFYPAKDNSVVTVFMRADRLMYQQKSKMKMTRM